MRILEANFVAVCCAPISRGSAAGDGAARSPSHFTSRRLTDEGAIRRSGQVASYGLNFRRGLVYGLCSRGCGVTSMS